MCVYVRVCERVYEHVCVAVLLLFEPGKTGCCRQVADL